jgi:hypothetical protein
MGKLNDKQRRFCELVVSGTPAGRAYEQAGYTAKGDDADCCAAKLQGNAKVVAYIEELREKAKAAAAMTLDDAVGFCISVLKSKPSDASMDNPLCEIKMSKAGPYAAFPDKARMLERLSQYMGWDKPKKVEITAEESLRSAFAGLAGPALPNDRDQI